MNAITNAEEKLMELLKEDNVTYGDIWTVTRPNRYTYDGLMEDDVKYLKRYRGILKRKSDKQLDVLTKFKLNALCKKDNSHMSDHMFKEKVANVAITDGAW